MFVSTSWKLEPRYINKGNRDVVKYEEVFGNMTVALNNAQNDTVINKKVTAAKFVFRRQSTFSELLVLSVDEFKLGRSDLILIDPAVKVNGA